MQKEKRQILHVHGVTSGRVTTNEATTFNFEQKGNIGNKYCPIFTTKKNQMRIHPMDVIQSLLEIIKTYVE